MFGMAAVEQGDVADALHQRGACGVDDGRDGSVAGFAVAHPQPYLDEFMAVESDVGLTQQCRGDAIAAHHHNRFESVSETAEILLLGVAEQRHVDRAENLKEREFSHASLALASASAPEAYALTWTQHSRAQVVG